MRYVPGQPTAVDIESLTEIRLPFVYLDWNVFQSLRKHRQADALLQAVSSGYKKSNVLLPYSMAHLFDATVEWERADRVERIREMVFAHGITDGWLWRIHDDRHSIDRRPLIIAAEEHGLTTSISSIVFEEPELAEAVKDQKAELLPFLAESHSMAATWEDPRRCAVETMLDALEEIGMKGLSDLSDVGSNWMRIFGSIILLSSTALNDGGSDFSAFCGAHPMDAVALLENLLRQIDPAMQLERILGLDSVTGNQHQDDIGPAMLGLLGYFPEDKKKIPDDSNIARFGRSHTPRRGSGPDGYAP